MKQFILKLMIFSLLLAVCSELFFRSVVPARESPITQTLSTYGIENYDPAQAQEGLFTSGRRAQQRSLWFINAQGWNQREDFETDPNRLKPFVAMLGDSYVEGFYVASESHVMRVLRGLNDQRIDTYQLGKSGSKFGHFIQMAKYLSEEQYTPEVLVILINRGDFVSSLAKPGANRGSLKIEVDDNGSARLTPSKTHKKVKWRRWLRKSAFVRYLIWNANLNPFGGTVDLAANHLKNSVHTNLETNPKFRLAFRFMHHRIKTYLPNTRQVYLVDADRRAFGEGNAPSPLPASKLIRGECSTLDCAHIDLTDTFYRYWKSTGQRLHFTHDYHWNVHANRLAAEALDSILKSRALIPAKE